VRSAKGLKTGHFYPIDKSQAVWFNRRMTNPVIEARRKALMAARTVAIDKRDWAAMNEITKRLAKLPVKGDKDYPSAT